MSVDVSISLKIAPRDLVRLKELAALKGTNVSALVRGFILVGLEDETQLGQRLLTELRQDPNLRAAMRRLIVLDLP